MSPDKMMGDLHENGPGSPLVLVALSVMFVVMIIVSTSVFSYIHWERGHEDLFTYQVAWGIFSVIIGSWRVKESWVLFSGSQVDNRYL